MKEIVYSCDICKKSCNGGGVSYDPSITAGHLLVKVSRDLNTYSNHVCGHECFSKLSLKLLTNYEQDTNNLST